MADNWYIVLELDFDPPVEDEKKISEKIEERAKYWSANFNHFKYGPQYRLWHQNLSQMKKDMIGPANIRKQLATEACAIVYEPVDKLLKVIGRKGNITSEEGKKIAEKSKIPIDTVEKRTVALGVKWVKVKTDFQSIYDKYYKTKPKNAATYEGFEKMLSAFGVDNLYDFLYRNTTIKNINQLPCKTLCLRSAELKKNEFYKSDSLSGTGTKLCNSCDITFKDESSKALYDTYLEYKKRVAILDEVKMIAEVSRKLTQEQWNDKIGQLTHIFKDRKLSEDVLIAFCEIEAIVYPNEEKKTQIRVCRCGCINDVSGGRKVCSNCGLELTFKCPKCGKEYDDVKIKVCECKFEFANMDKAIALCAQAEHAIDTLDFAIADVHLKDAEHYWPNSSKVSTLRNRLKEYEKRVGAEVTKMRDAIKQKKYCEAKKQYQSIQKLFASYSDKEMEKEIEDAIVKARNLLNQAKATKVEKDILDLCAKAYDICVDLPGIKEMMPAPHNVNGFEVKVNQFSRMNNISWTAFTDHSIRYVVVRSKNGWIQNISDGDVIFRGSASSYADKDIEAGVVYYYNVFAERAGMYSKGANGKFEEIINLFEVTGTSVTAGDSSLNIAWDKIPKNATVEIYEVQKNGQEKHIVSSTASNYLIANLENGVWYKYRVALSYIVSGKKQETKGVIETGKSDKIPLPIETLRIKQIQEGVFEAVWMKENTGDVRLYASTTRPTYPIGATVSVVEIEKKMLQLQKQNLSGQFLNTLKPNETGVTFSYKEKNVLYVVAVVVQSGTGVFGNIARVSAGEVVNIKGIRPINGKINIFLDVPQNAIGFVVLYRFDKFPTDIGDVESVRKYISLRQYQLNSAIVLDTMEDKKYYFTVYAEFREAGERDYSAGAEYLFDNCTKVNITYSIEVNKRLFGESNVILEFEADSKMFQLPAIDIMSAIGNTPMFKSSAKLFHEIAEQEVKGSVKIKIPIPKNIARDTYIKAFFKEEAMQNKSQLKLKLGSEYKIT